MVKLRHRHQAEQDKEALRPPAAEDADLQRQSSRQAHGDRPLESRTVVEERPDAARRVADEPQPFHERRTAGPAPAVTDLRADPGPEAITTETMVTWGPGQLVGMIVGVGMLILGTVALTRSGLDVNSLYSPHIEVAGLHHTPLLGVVEVVFGLLVVAASAVPGTVRGLLVLLGVGALAAGIVVLAATGTWLHDHFGTHRANGWLFIVDGSLLVLAAMLPGARLRHVKVSGRGRRVYARSRVGQADGR